MKVTVIEEFKDLSKIGTDKLIGSLFTYKMKRKPYEEKVKAKKDIALKLLDEKEKKGNFFMDEDDVNLLARKFSKFLLRSKRNKEKEFTRQRGKKDDGKKSNMR